MKVELWCGERAFWIVLFTVVVTHLLAYALLAYPTLPQTAPMHWGADGVVDGWGDKAGTLFMVATPLVVALVMLAVPHLDPKGRNFERFRGVYQTELLADDGPGTCAFYESLGFTRAERLGCVAYVRLVPAG